MGRYLSDNVRGRSLSGGEKKNAIFRPRYLLSHTQATLKQLFCLEDGSAPCVVVFFEVLHTPVSIKRGIANMRRPSLSDAGGMQVQLLDTARHHRGLTDPPRSDAKDVAASIVPEYAQSWDPVVERRVVRKIDMILMPFMWIGYGLVYYDKVCHLPPVPLT